jgi:DNA-binding transcriptional LysR family regulator
VDEVTGLLSGRLTVGMVTACTITALFDALATFHRAHPGVAITLLEDNSAALAEHVRSGAIDVALIGAAAAPPPGLASFPIVSERLVAAVPRDHHFSERTRLTLSDLTGCPLICMPEGTGIRTVFDQICAARGVRLDVALEASAPNAVADLAARGLGVAILSETIAAAHADQLRAAVIDDIEILAQLALVWKPTPSPAAAEFLTHSRRVFAPAQPPDPSPA